MVTLTSAHGSPGVTTTALVLAATWPDPRRCLLVEADPIPDQILTDNGKVRRFVDAPEVLLRHPWASALITPSVIVHFDGV